MRRWWLVALTALAAVLPTVAGAQQRVQTTAEAMAQDAATWAAVAGISPERARARLDAQIGSTAATDALAAEFEDRLAGIYVEADPDYRIVVLLAGDAPVPGRMLAVAGKAVRVEFRTGAPATRAALLAAIADHQAALRAAVMQPPGIGIDPRRGMLTVLVSPADAAAGPLPLLAERLARIAGVPVRVSVLGGAVDLADGAGSANAGGGSLAAAAVTGGARVVGVNPADGHRYACTTGFTVSDGTRTGVLTAAHCPDTLTLVAPGAGGVPLDFVGQWGWGYQDVQVHASQVAAAAPTFVADTGKTLARGVTAVVSRAATRAGDVVCHRGERTGYSCAEVVLTDFAPAGDLCGGNCLPSWVAVRGPGCRSGDSGGPVFLGTTAYGIVKGGSYGADGGCGFYYYMSLDYLPAGWAPLRTEREADAEPARPAVRANS